MHHRLAISAVAILAALFQACAPVIKTGPAPTRPPEAPPMAPMIEKAQATAAAQSETSAKLETKVQALRETTEDLRAGMATATDEANRLRVQKTATEKELTDLWGLMTRATERVAGLVKQVDESQALAESQKRQRLEAEQALRDAAAAAAAVDSEAATLRAQHDAMAGQIEQARQTESKLQQSLTTAEKKAAVGSYLKGVVWVLAIAIFLAAALWIASKWRVI